ncbi:MAG: hypothetical protein WC043_02835 [Pseudobdellovibrionaceae bacterium]
MIWHRLDRDKTLDMISRVKSTGEAVLFSPVTSEAKCSRLPFFKTYMLYRLTNFSSLPVFTLDYISNGESFSYMDGSDSPIRHMVDAGELTLTEENIIAYINFYFCYVRQPEGEMIILKNLAEAATIDLYDEDRREEFDAQPENISLEHNIETGNFCVVTEILYDSSPMEAIIDVSFDGRIKVTPRKMLTLDLIQ